MSSSRLYTLTELRETPPPKHLVHGVLEEGSVTSLIGKSSHGKTFVALDLALSIATGVPWHGRDVQQGAVVYLGAEGARNFAKRATAWEDLHGITMDPPFYVLPAALNLMRQGAVDILIEHLDALPSTPRLIIIDPLANFMPGAKQDSASDVALLNATSIQVLRQRCALLVLMHAGWKDERERGSSALRDIVDASMILRAGNINQDKRSRPLTLKSLKARDMDPFPPITLSLQAVTVAVDQTITTTCVVMDPPPSDPNAQPESRIATPKMQRALGVLREAGPDGLNYSAWRKASAVGEGTIARTVRHFLSLGAIEKRNERYCAVMDSAQVSSAETSDRSVPALGSSSS